MNKLIANLTQYWHGIQGSLFPHLQEELDPLTKKQKHLIAILDFVQIERYVPHVSGYVGRPQQNRSALARSYVAKMVYNMDTNTALIERLQSDRNFRRICGWEKYSYIPSESTFSRAFAEFAASKLPAHVHEKLIERTLKDEIVTHNSRDSTAIHAREKVTVKKSEPEKKEETPKKKKRGRPKKGEVRTPAEPTRIEKQTTMNLDEMLEDLPKNCNKGAKKDSKGNVMYWSGYKLHLDIADRGIPISAIVTSASVHDSQVAIPLATVSSKRVTNLYDLMDAAYDVKAIKEHSESLGHVPLIDSNPRGSKTKQAEKKAEAKAKRTINLKTPQDLRYNERSTAERANARLKDEFGASKLRVRGHMKVSCHLMFGVLVLAADQLLRLVQ